MNNEQCPCGTGKDFNNCCGPIIEGRLPAQTAEELMRSRYTAFTLANGDYLMKSHHPGTRNPKDKANIEKWAKSVIWLKLEILNFTLGLPKDNLGTVEFKAFYLENGRVQFIHENSIFKRVLDSWLYYGLV